jgi:hypothetical protein
MTKEDIQEVFDCIRNTKCVKAVYTTHDLGIMQTVKGELLEALKQKWPHEAANLSTAIPSTSHRLATF